MTSKQLILKLIRQCGSAYKLAKESGISEQIISHVRHGRRPLTADQLAGLVDKGLIRKEDAKDVHFKDGLKNGRLFRLVASVAVAVPGMQLAIQEFGVNAINCILCKIRSMPQYRLG